MPSPRPKAANATRKNKTAYCSIVGTTAPKQAGNNRRPVDRAVQPPSAPPKTRLPSNTLGVSKQLSNVPPAPSATKQICQTQHEDNHHHCHSIARAFRRFQKTGGGSGRVRFFLHVRTRQPGRNKACQLRLFSPTNASTRLTQSMPTAATEAVASHSWCGKPHQQHQQHQHRCTQNRERAALASLDVDSAQLSK